MANIEQSIFNDGKIEGKQDLLTKILLMKIFKISENYREKIKSLKEYEIDVMVMKILNMTNSEEIKEYVEKYFS
ncbi:MAG: DUF4351 domain-containing protein [Clostridioides sp.]|nr:DUF4351 domain-containing protein [Clostridioides sp.]